MGTITVEVWLDDGQSQDTFLDRQAFEGCPPIPGDVLVIEGEFFRVIEPRIYFPDAIHVKVEEVR